jgi:RHS repeat-associated protein
MNTANNRIVGNTYDANGNTSAVASSGNTYDLAYDAENRMTGAYLSSNTSVFVDYFYDAQNKRIWSGTGAVDGNGNATNYTVNVYTPSGQKLAAYTIAPGVFGTSYTPALSMTVTSIDQYFGSRRVAAMDRLGSAGPNGGSVGTFYPWGEDQGTTNPQNIWSYATYWRDSISGLDYANNRYYTSAYGRFMTPDPYQGTSGGPGDSNNPQTWNRYAHVFGDPVNWIDPSGLDGCPAGTQPGPNGDGCVPIPPPQPGAPTIPIPPPTNPTPQPPKGPGASTCPSGWVKGPYGNCITQEQQCLNSFNSSTAGQIVSFLSALNLVTNFGNSYLDWTLLPGAKAAALQLLQYLSKEFGSTEFLSVTGASSGTIVAGETTILTAAIEAAAAPLSAGIPIATAVDAGVRQMCSQVPGLTFFQQ